MRIVGRLGRDKSWVEFQELYINNWFSKIVKLAFEIGHLDDWNLTNN